MEKKALYTVPILLLSLCANNMEAKDHQPNVIYIMADDLGIGDLGCYGQRFIKTPAIDSLAKNGVCFAQHYSGCTVSAPSRCSLMTGKHTGHSYIRGNKPVMIEGTRFDYPLADEEITVAEIMKKHNYQTACIGKWGLGGPGTEGHPNNQGFDYFFGYLGQANAHKYYPQFLYENQKRVNLDKKVYSHDLIMQKAFDFIKDNKDNSFFLYLTPTIPHAELIVPDNQLMGYDGMFDEKPFKGTKSYCAQNKPRATYAAMVSRLDNDVRKLVEILKENGSLENTIIVFTSDNGTHIEGGHDPFAFNSSGGFRGHKRDMYEGGIRTPFIVQWPSKIAPGTVSYHISAFWDFMATICDLLGESLPVNSDGISYLPELTGEKEQVKHDYLYWEFHEGKGNQAVLKDNWKLIKFNVDNPSKSYYELYNLNSDPTEQLNVAGQFPSLVDELKKIMDKSHTHNRIYEFDYEK